MGLDWGSVVYLHILYALSMLSSCVFLLVETAEAQYLGKELSLHRKPVYNMEVADDSALERGIGYTLNVSEL